MRYPPFIEEEYPFPDLFRVTIDYPQSQLENLTAELIKTIDAVLPQSGIRRGDSVAVGVGSRGIAHLPLMVSTLCLRLKQIGAKPVIIPAMGSHGGATSAGQQKVLEQLGVTEASCGCPIRSSLDVNQIGTVFNHVPVFFSRDALDMNHSVCLNRIKPHTKFKAPIESGLMKMICVGMGKHQGALAYHRWALTYGFFSLLEAMGRMALEQTNLRFGIGVVEDAYDQTAIVEAIPANLIEEREMRLLKTAKDHFPYLPIQSADVLIIGQIGKDISGAGMDPNVTGRAYDFMEDDFSHIFKATRVAILNLSKKTDGNGLGLGSADIITEKVWRNLDYETTVINALTSVSLRKAFIPIRLPDDRKAIQACLTTIGPVDLDSIRVIVIKDTLHTSELWVTEPVLDEISRNSRARVWEKSRFEFDSDGEMTLPFRIRG